MAIPGTPRRVCDFERQRRNIADDQADAVALQGARFVGDSLIQVAIELDRLAHRRLIVLADARWLDDGCVARAGAKLTGHVQPPFEQRWTDSGPQDNARCRVWLSQAHE